MQYQSLFNSAILPNEMRSSQDSDLDFITHDLFHQPTLDENDIADRLHIEPFFEGA